LVSGFRCFVISRFREIRLGVGSRVTAAHRLTQMCMGGGPRRDVHALQSSILLPVVELGAFLSSPVRRTASDPSRGALNRFPNIAAAPERASGAIARFDVLLIGHPLGARLALAYPAGSCSPASRLRRASDHVAAVIAGLRFRMDGAAAIINRSAIFEARVMPSTVEAGLPRPMRR
jgi:hypothetical protein